MPYNTKQAAVDSSRPGWRISGEQPNMVNVPNPRAGEYGQPAQIQEQQGILLTIQSPNKSDPPDTMIIKEVGNNPDTKGGVGFDVVQGPTKAVPEPKQTATPAAGLERLDANMQPVGPDKPAVYVRDPNAPAGTAPYKLADDEAASDPSKWETREIAGATIVYDPGKGKVVATIPAKSDAAAKRTGVYEDMIDPNDPKGKKVIGKVDTGSKEIFNVTTAGDKKQVVTTPSQIFVLNEDGSVANTIKVDKDKAIQAVIVGDETFAFDPATGVFTPGPKGTKAATLSIDTTAKDLIWYDENGKEVSRQPNTNYRPPTATLPTPSLSAPNLLVPDPDKPGQYKWIPNTGRVTIGEATQNLIKSLTGETVDPNNPLTLDEAKTVIDGAIARMTSEAQQATTAAGAAQNILTTQQQGAQTGAGMLQARATNAQNLIQQGLNVATSTGGRYGNYSGGMLSPVPGLGQALTQGAQAYATELGGGQEVFDTAVRMVQAADPNGQNPDRAAAVATLTQVMDRYKQSTGQDYPTVAATKAAAASQANQGMVAPGTPVVSPAEVGPAVFQAQFDPRFNPAAPQQPVNTILPPGVAGTVAPGDPRYLGIPATMTQPRSAAALGFTAPGMSPTAGLGQALGDPYGRML